MKQYDKYKYQVDVQGNFYFNIKGNKYCLHSSKIPTFCYIRLFRVMFTKFEYLMYFFLCRFINIQIRIV